MSATNVFLSLIYLVYVVSPAIKDELWLRLALVVTSVGFAIWGTQIDDGLVVIIANALFAAVSLRHIVRLIMNRRAVELEAGQARVRNILFPSMSEREFLLFWHLGSERVVDPGTLIEKGETLRAVTVVLDGTYRVSGNGAEKVIDAPGMVGEMSFVRGENATANATVSLEQVTLIREWRNETLRDLQRSHPDLAVPFLRSLGADIATKVSS